MKYLIALFMLIALSRDGFANNVYIYQPPIVQQQIIVTQTMVYQVPYLVVTVPVQTVIYPPQVIDQRIYWPYPYYTTTPMPVIEKRHRCWNY